MEHRERSMTNNTRYDEKLVARSVLGDKVAFSELRQRHDDRLKGFLRSRTHRWDVDDLDQEIWMHVMRTLPNLRDRSLFHYWLISVANRRLSTRNRADRQSKRSVDKTVSLDQIKQSGFDAPDTRRLDGFDKAVLSEAIELLTKNHPRWAEFIQLSLEGYTAAEIATSLGLSAEYVKNRLHLAKAYLREIYGSKEKV